MQRRAFLATTAGGLAGALTGCLGGGGGEGTIAESTLTIATATSIYDTGLLDALNEAFTDRFGASVDAAALGTGAALRTGENGDADLVLVHARSLEDEFISEGYGINRRTLMFNDFVLVGPASDPARIDGTEAVTDAFETLAEAEATFVSRGDDSGTHVREREIWDAAGIAPSGSWYREAGSGMGQVLSQANLTGSAYTLADRGTFRSMRDAVDLEILLAGPIERGPALLANPYGIVAVNPAVHDHVAYDLAMAYIGFVTSVEGQDVIGTYTNGGEQLFFPDAIAADPNFQQYVPAGWRREGTDG